MGSGRGAAAGRSLRQGRPTQNQGLRGAHVPSASRRVPRAFQFSRVPTGPHLDQLTHSLCLGMGNRRANGDDTQVKGKRASVAAAPRPPIPPPPSPSSHPRPLLFRPEGRRGRAVCVCMYACTRVCARKCGSPVCEFRVWLGVGCVLHALVRVLSVKWVCFELRFGACVCVCPFVGCTFPPGWSGTVWVRSGCGCVRCVLLPGSVFVL